jgi:cell division protein FtsN
MRKMLFLLFISTIAFSGCKFIGGKSVKSERDSLRVYAFTLEQKIANQEQNHKATLDQLKRESQATIDSIIMLYESEDATGKGNYSAAASGNYYVIVGSFKTPSYASNWSGRVADKGYQTEIVQVSHWNLVSAKSGTNLKSVLNELSSIRSNITSNAWVYVGR